MATTVLFDASEEKDDTENDDRKIFVSRIPKDWKDEDLQTTMEKAFGGEGAGRLI
jgi:hypothetical protein